MFVFTYSGCRSAASFLHDGSGQPDPLTLFFRDYFAKVGGPVASFPRATLQTMLQLWPDTAAPSELRALLAAAEKNAQGNVLVIDLDQLPKPSPNTGLGSQIPVGARSAAPAVNPFDLGDYRLRRKAA